jgi:hypothetical protein
MAFFRLPWIVPALLCGSALCFGEPPTSGQLPEAVSQSLERISADSMRGHLSFLASDLLEGRNTPSRGLTIAAEYIAAQFRRAGLEPVPGTESYFQTARWTLRKVDQSAAKAEILAGGRSVQLSGSQLTILSLEGLDLAPAPIYKLAWEEADSLKDLAEGALEEFIILIEAPSPQRLRKLSNDERMAMIRRIGEFSKLARKLKPKAVVSWNSDTMGDPDEAQQLIDPETDGRRAGRRFTPSVAILHSPALGDLWNELPGGRTSATLRIHLPAGAEEPVELHNVVGILPGSDPDLKNSYVLVTAHYDHVGLGEPDANGDRIYNGANDDASGTVSMLEIASAMAASKRRPARTIVFIALFGEERGLLGAKYYARHPIFPIKDTAANLNLEHMGRTDSSEGPQVARLSPTGFDFSEITDVLREAGELTGVEIFHHTRNSEAFFSRSDNAAFADVGIPSTTVCVAFEFPEYHGPGDHWDKIDYQNMAKVTRTMLATTWLLAERPSVPAWKTDRYKRQTE